MTKNPVDATSTDFASITSNFQYKTSGNTTTNLISCLNNTITGEETNTVNYSYTYDSNGRITGISTVSSVPNLSGASQYIYDGAGQLVREVAGSTTYEYAYDLKGNISSRKTYSNGTLTKTDTFTYGADSWEDRLTGYGNKTIAYDEIGNPTSYLGATLIWRGRELAGYEKGNKQISYSYDVDGMRYQKIVTTDGVETARYDYVYSDGKLILLTYTANGTSNTTRFIYDSWGEPRGFILNNTAAYIYLKNAQGDITAIVDENGEVLLTYTYTAWGKVTYSATSMQSMLLAATLSNVNPFTYRGYCYDYDIGMYYLQSRYYDPEICRFINADSTEYLGATGTLLSYNLFAYCENEPVGFVDVTGCAAIGFSYTTSQDVIINKCIQVFESSSLFDNSYSRTPPNWQYTLKCIKYYTKGENKGTYLLEYKNNWHIKNFDIKEKKLVGKVICLTVAEWKAYIVSRHDTLYLKCKRQIERLIGEDGFSTLLDWIELVAEDTGHPFIQCCAKVLNFACEVYEYYSEKYKEKFDKYVKKYIDGKSNKKMYAIVISSSDYIYRYNGRYYAWKRVKTVRSY